MTHRISPLAIDLLFLAARRGRDARTDRPAPDDRPPERKARRARWFAGLRNRPPLV